MPPKRKMEHPERRFVPKIECIFCDKAFRHKLYLEIHMRVHTNERPYQCSLCPANYTHIGCLKTHKIGVHSGIKYKCDVCGKISSLWHNFQVHRMKKHPQDYNPSDARERFVCSGNYEDPEAEVKPEVDLFASLSPSTKALDLARIPNFLVNMRINQAPKSHADGMFFLHMNRYVPENH